jgi:hypothetical protein
MRWLLASPAPVRGDRERDRELLRELGTRREQSDRERNQELLEAKEAQLRALKEMAVGAADEDLIEYVERRERALKRLQIEYEAMSLGGNPQGSRSATKRPGEGR